MASAEEMGAVFECIRADVLQEATRPVPYDAGEHAANQARFKEHLARECAKSRFRGDRTADELWQEVWEKVRFAGFRAAFVECEIERLRPFFLDFRQLVGPQWHFDPDGIAHGELVRDFLRREGPFAAIGSYNTRDLKLRTILKAAEKFRSFAGIHPLAELFGEGYDQPGDETLWKAHGHLETLVGFTTALHIMTSLGFPCVKPDIWLVRLMCRFGWIENVLAWDSGEIEIRKKYQTREVAESVIRSARKAAGAIQAWHPATPLREFDLVMVKYGQDPDREWGIVRSLWQDMPRVVAPPAEFSLSYIN